MWLRLLGQVQSGSARVAQTQSGQGLTGVLLITRFVQHLDTKQLNTNVDLVRHTLLKSSRSKSSIFHAFLAVIGISLNWLSG